jgi:hypothetical protein
LIYPLGGEDGERIERRQWREGARFDGDDRFRMEFTTFSCFDNFVRGNNVGIPDHTPLNFALQHLEE